MSNVVLSWPNKINLATITSPQTWVTSMPLYNISDPVFSHVAKVNLTATDINMTFSDFTTVGTVALANHNLSSDATIRIKLFYDTAMTDLLIDTGILSVWSAVFDTTGLEWETNNFWDGLPDNEQRARFTTLFYTYLDNNYGCKASKISLSDPLNADGFITIGRAILAPYFIPAINADYGFDRGFTTSTEKTDCNDTEYFRVKRQRRTKSLQLSSLTKGEAIFAMYDMQRSQGIDGEVLYSDQTEIDQYSMATSFVGRLTDLNPITMPNFTQNQVRINLKEIV
jgi:hypothetical protein